MSDLQLRQYVLDELQFEPSVNAAHIGVAAAAGVVTLTGHVGTYVEKLAAVAATKRVKGVRGIADDIKVRHAYIAFEPREGDGLHMTQQDSTFEVDLYKSPG